MTTEQQRPSDSDALLGLALLSPAFIALIWTYVIPTLATVVKSFRGHPAPTSADNDKYQTWVGLANYRQALSDHDTLAGHFAGQFGNALLLTLIPLGLTLLAAPLLALAALRAGRRGRLVTRALLAVPLAGWVPAALALGWALKRTHLASYRAHPLWSIAWGVGVLTAGVVLAAGVTVFLAAWRPGAGPAGRRAGWVAAAVLGLGVVATTLQASTVPGFLGLWTFADETGVRPLPIGQYDYATSTLMLVPLCVLGVLLVWLLLASRARIEWAPAGPEERPRWSPLIVGLLLVVGLLGYACLPMFRAYKGELSILTHTPSEGVLHTWLAPMIWLAPMVAALVSVGVAALGGYGIGALRPLGRRSELLLLLFAPWLLVGIRPLAQVFSDRAGAGDGLLPQVWVCIPALAVFTLYFRGRQGQGATGRSLLRPAVPLVGLAVLVVWLATTPYSRDGLGNLDRFIIRGTGVWRPISLFAVVLVLLVAAQFWYVDRLAFRVGPEASLGGDDQPSSSASTAPVGSESSGLSTSSGEDGGS
jgi:hypothetical protein